MTPEEFARELNLSGEQARVFVAEIRNIIAPMVLELEQGRQWADFEVLRESIQRIALVCDAVSKHGGLFEVRR